MIWKILEIEKTKDEELIKKAYREKLRYVNPEDDEEGFKELRRAYEEALNYASMEGEGVQTATDVNQDLYRKKNEVDLWIDKVDVIYRNVKTRIDEEKWNTILKDPVCDNLDTELEAAEKLLVYFMSHSYMPQNIWQLVNNRFKYIDNFEQLKEKFPENYLEYVKWQINRPNFIDYELFSGKTDSDVDAYINKLYEVKSLSEDEDLPRLQQLIKELKRFDVTHPFTQTEEARCLLIEAKLITDEASEKKKGLLSDALSIMEDLDFEYSDNPYIERIYAEVLIDNGKVDKASAVFDSLLEKKPDNYSAMLGKAKCVFLNGNLEEAKEQIEDILEDRVQDADSLLLLEQVNEKLVEKYESQLEEQFEREICFKLGWCYYQQKKFEKGIELLDQLESNDEYDYVNLRCRLYLANENYDKARPVAELWLKLIEESEDDGSKEMKKRQNRLSLAHFSIGVCVWEDTYKNAKPEMQDSIISEVVFYINKAIEEETNLMVKMSYMEQLARFYLEAKNYKACIGICDDIIKADRGFFPAYAHRQKAHYELKNAKEVIDDYYSCVEIFPGYAPPYIYAAEVFYAFEQYDDVEQILETAKEAGIQSDSLELYRIRCLHYKEFSKQNVQLALEQILALRQRVMSETQDKSDIEDFAELEKELAIIYWDMDETEKSLNTIDAYLGRNPGTSSLLFLKVDILNREKRYDEANDVCKELVSLEPSDIAARYKLGNSYEYQENTQKAIECYKEILEVNNEYAPAIRRLMYIYSYLSNRKNSLKICKTAIMYASRFIELTNSAEGYVERGNLYIDLYELEKAVKDCEKAIELDPDAYYAYNNLGCALLKLRREKEAIHPLEQAIAIDPDKEHLPYLNLAECYVLQQQYDKAIWAYEEVLRLQSNANHIHKNIAKIYVQKKEFEKAITIYQSMVEAVEQKMGRDNLWKRFYHCSGEEPDDEENELLLLYCEIGDVYRQAQDYKNATKYYEKVYRVFHKMVKHYSAGVTEKLAEYYRDAGQLKRALWVMKRTMGGKLSKKEIGTKAESHLRFVYTTILFELGDKTNAKHNAKIYISELLERYETEERMMEDLRYRPMHLYDMAIMYICAGDLEKGKYYLEQIKSCQLCVICETCDCFEYHFGMGLIAELEGDKEKAKTFFQRALEIKGDYPCAKRHLDNLAI